MEKLKLLKSILIGILITVIFFGAIGWLDNWLHEEPFSLRKCYDLIPWMWKEVFNPENDRIDYFINAALLILGALLFILVVVLFSVIAFLSINRPHYKSKKRQALYGLTNPPKSLTYKLKL